MNNKVENKLYEYAVIRIVPRVEREEFLNVGIILFCKKQDFLQVKYLLDPIRLAAFSCHSAIPELEMYLQTWVKICKGGIDGGPIGELDTASRFRWLTATRSTVVQTSKVHPGFCEDPKQKLDLLFSELVQI
jgi:Protein of unknown function (DUF3037)